MPDSSLPMPIVHEVIADVAQRHGVSRIRMFGSGVIGGFGPESDVDLIVEFQPGRMPSFFQLARLKTDLSEAFGGREVDIVVPGNLRPHWQKSIFEHTHLIYEAA